MLGIAVLIFGSSVFASTNGYDLKLDLSMDGKHLSSPRIIVKAGELATVMQKINSEERFIEVIANEGTIQNHKGILLNFTVGIIGENGKKIIVSKPQIFTKENKTAQITVDGDNGAKSFTLSVVAQRKSL